MHGNHVAPTLSRRHFILTAATAAGGFMIGIAAKPRAAYSATVPVQPWSDGNGYAANDIDAWIAIDPDDSILIRYQRSEMGQGSMTALPMIVTEELGCDWSKVRIEYASPNRNVREDKVYGDMFSNGSRTVRASLKKMQQVGASARERLVAAEILPGANDALARRDMVEISRYQRLGGKLALGDLPSGVSGGQRARIGHGGLH